ncbi:hypothetical protein ACSXBB_10810 [Clostridium perfringens]
MSNYEKWDLFFTALNFILLISTSIIGWFVNENRKNTNKDKQEIQTIATEVKKYRDTIVKNTHLISLNITLEELKKINKKIDDIVFIEKRDDRGFDIFKEYHNISKKIFDIKQNIPSKYNKLEDELDSVRNILDRHKDKNLKLSETGEVNDIDSILNSVIRVLKKDIEKLELK